MMRHLGRSKIVHNSFANVNNAIVGERMWRNPQDRPRMHVVGVSFAPVFTSCWSRPLTHAKKVPMRVRIGALPWML
jgi:hypothetical protein